MRERNEPAHQRTGERKFTALAMPRQVPPVDRTVSAAADDKNAPGVEASGLLRILFGL
ncbi:hypothetical protein [Streptomyces sp. NPDC005876]|uniref:hypothetical protein n=1 Tax=unclassified Streptomyces TaxID=2593676 RepID=UPI0033F371FA